jgi:hypothetical protein
MSKREPVYPDVELAKGIAELGQRLGKLESSVSQNSFVTISDEGEAPRVTGYLERSDRIGRLLLELERNLSRIANKF